MLYLNEQIVSEEPPKEIRLIKYGVTQTTKGDYRFDKEAAMQLMSIYNSRGLHLYFDYNHLSIGAVNEEQAKAAGWFDLELRDDGLYAVNIRWTPKAYEMIKNKEFMYISPVIQLDEEKRVIRLINGAICNLPSTSDLDPLTLLTAEQIKEVVKFAAKKEQERVELSLGDKMKLEESIKHLQLSKKYLKGYAVHSSKGMADSEDDSLKNMYAEHHTRCMEMIEHTKSHMKRLAPNHLEPDGDEVMEDEDVTMMSELVTLTGKTNKQDQLIVLTAYKNAVDTVKILSKEKVELEKEIQKLKMNAIEVEKEKLEEEAINGKEKKLFPKQKTWALSLSLEGLKNYLEVTPVFSFAEKVIQPTVVMEEEAQVKLTEIDEEAIKLIEASGIKINRSKYLEDKKKKLGLKR